MSLKHNILSYSLTIVAVASLQGCHLYKEFEMPTEQSSLISEYVEAQKAIADDPNKAGFGATPWQEIFTDPVLVEFINMALANNTNLENAKLNIDIAEAQLRGAKMSYLPAVSFNPNVSTASYGGSHINWGYTLPIAVSWEADIFGKILNSNRSAKASLMQSEAYRQAVQSQIVAGVANCYYSIANIEAQLDLARKTSALWEESVGVMENLKLAGRVNEAAVVQSKAQRQGILVSISELELSLEKVNNSLSLLLGIMPQKWNISANAMLTCPAPFVNGVPMTALAMRPDVRAAEYSMATAYYATNRARAAFYPGLTISTNGGFTNVLGSMISNPGEFFIQLAGSLSAPIFSRGVNEANLATAKAQQQQAMNNFEYSLMSASAEVRDALTTYEKNEEKGKHLVEQVDYLQKAVEYTNDLLIYSTGTYLEVLTAQQSLLSAQMSLLSCQLAKSQAIINLYQALGGGQN